MTGRPMSLPPAEFYILLALADGTKHGRAIKLDVRERTQGEIDMGPGTLYGAIKRLLRKGWIEEEAVADLTDERLRCYSATTAGLEAARHEARRIEALVGFARVKELLG